MACWQRRVHACPTPCVAGTEFTGSALNQLLRIIAAGVLCGVGFGLVMSIVSNGFVIGVKWLTEQREGMSFGMMSVGGLELSAAPLLSLVLAACLILLVRKLFDFPLARAWQTAFTPRTAPTMSLM